MNARSLRKLLASLLITTPGCASSVASVADAGQDRPAMDLPSPVDVVDASSEDITRPDIVDAPPPDAVTTDTVDASVEERNCGPCGCDFTGLLVGRTAMRVEYCADYADDAGADDASAASDASALDPARCEVDCNRACASVTVSGFGISRPWAGGGPPGGGAPGTCARVDGGTVRCEVYLPCGRRTEGQRDLDAGGGVSGYLLRAAHLEAQAVGAFARMSAELTAHDAPSSLVRAAERSGREEARHATLMRELCAARGLEAAPVADAPSSVRALAEIARENAVEGCAGETWGALVAMHQAAFAEDPAVRAAMTEIARDEVRHAALAWAVDRWAMARLDDSAREEIRRARHAAWDALLRAVSNDPDDALGRALGLPGGATASRLAQGLRTALAV